MKSDGFSKFWFLLAGLITVAIIWIGVNNQIDNSTKVANTPSSSNFTPSYKPATYSVSDVIASKLPPFDNSFDGTTLVFSGFPNPNTLSIVVEYYPQANWAHNTELYYHIKQNEIIHIKTPKISFKVVSYNVQNGTITLLRQSN